LSRKRPGALTRIEQFHAAPDGPLPKGDQERAWRLIADLQRLLPDVDEDARGWMEQLAVDALDGAERTLRLTPGTAIDETWQTLLAPTVDEAARRLGEAATLLAELSETLNQLPPEARTARPQPLFDLARASKRVTEMAAFCSTFAPPPGEDAPAVRWIEEARGSRHSAALSTAPVEPGPLIRERLFDMMHTCVATSATLTVGGQFDHFLGRVGLLDAPTARVVRDDAPPPSFGPAEGVSTGVFPSPFDYSRQAILALPRDLPTPDHPDFEEAVSAFTMDAVQASDGGAFVLCTSYKLLDAMHARAQRTLGGRMQLFRQGQMGRDRLLAAFRASGNGVLFGTDSFWEGVSVAGEALRLVVIPKLPFRVPTEPVQQARHERIAAQGLDPFRAYSLPQAVLRLRQGFGRLVRTRQDRGAVAVLDRRVLDRWYGRMFLSSLPQMPRATGPSRAVIERLRAFYAD